MPRHKIYQKKHIQVDGLSIEVLRKNVKNLNLRVYPAEHTIRISVPRLTPDEIVRSFIEDKLPWIRKHLAKKNSRKPPQKNLQYTTGEKLLVWGDEYELQVNEINSPPKVNVTEQVVHLKVRPGTDLNKRAMMLKEWYRTQLKEEIPKLIEKWEPIMKVSVREFGVKDMKTRWGTCNIRAKRIWLNLQLAKKRPELLEYVVVHEMTHLHERLHNKRFYGLMTKFLPDWKALQDELNGRSSMRSC